MSLHMFKESMKRKKKKSEYFLFVKFLPSKGQLELRETWYMCGSFSTFLYDSKVSAEDEAPRG